MTEVSLVPADYRCTVELQVRFRDLDAMEHINNAVFFTYFAMGRAAYLPAIRYPDDQTRGLHERFPFILAEISCRYISPATMDHALNMGLRIVSFGNKSWRVEYLVYRRETGRPVATGRSIQVFFDYQKKHAISVPDWFIELVEAFEGRTLRSSATDSPPGAKSEIPHRV